LDAIAPKRAEIVYERISMSYRRMRSRDMRSAYPESRDNSDLCDGRSRLLRVTTEISDVAGERRPGGDTRVDGSHESVYSFKAEQSTIGQSFEERHTISLQARDR
jgi:hypothetical protein